ncbi:MAG: NUDIX domain-containing protein [Nanoarchaeota archaeon]|nr:NUDIX domain-containing protein [Nanoarchaeota archaeon]
MRKTSRLIIIKENKILLIHRIKPNRDYYVFPGGAVEKGETKEEAAIRETKEETNLDIKIDHFLWKFKNIFDKDKNLEYYFLIKKFKGVLKLRGPEAKKQTKDNQYLLEWIPLSKLKKISLFPEEIKIKVLKEFR